MEQIHRKKSRNALSRMTLSEKFAIVMLNQSSVIREYHAWVFPKTGHLQIKGIRLEIIRYTDDPWH